MTIFNYDGYGISEEFQKLRVVTDYATPQIIKPILHRKKSIQQ